MPRRVGIPHRVEARIRIAMIVQRIARRRHDRIRREELAQGRAASYRETHPITPRYQSSINIDAIAIEMPPSLVERISERCCSA